MRSKKHMPSWSEDELFDMQVFRDIDQKTWAEVMAAVNAEHGNFRSAEACREQYLKIVREEV